MALQKHSPVTQRFHHICRYSKGKKIWPKTWIPNSILTLTIPNYGWIIDINYNSIIQPHISLKFSIPITLQKTTWLNRTCLFFTPNFYLSTDPIVVPNTYPPGPYTLPSSFPTNTPIISTSSDLSSKSTDTHSTSPMIWSPYLLQAHPCALQNTF